jgi:hypothetical protein
VSAARVLLAAGRPAAARARLDALPPSAAWDPSVAALRVRVAEADATTAPEALDQLLDSWHRVDPRAPAPVRRRIDLREREGRWDEALALVPALRARAPGTGVDALRTSLLAARERWDDAAASAPEPTRGRLLARGAWSRGAAPPARAGDGAPAPASGGRVDPAAPSAAAGGGAPDASAGDLVGDDPVTRLAQGEAALVRGAHAEALALADTVVASNEARADAWALRARALEALGRGGLATEAWNRAWERDPGLPGGTVERDRVASTFRVAAPAAAAAATDPAPARGRARRAGRKGPEL